MEAAQETWDAGRNVTGNAYVLLLISILTTAHEDEDPRNLVSVIIENLPANILDDCCGSDPLDPLLPLRQSLASG